MVSLTRRKSHDDEGTTRKVKINRKFRRYSSCVSTAHSWERWRKSHIQAMACSNLGDVRSSDNHSCVYRCYRLSAEEVAQWVEVTISSSELEEKCCRAGKSSS